MTSMFRTPSPAPFCWGESTPEATPLFGRWEQPGPTPRQRGVHLLLLMLVLGAAAFLRFAGITQVGIRFDDEGAYAADARLWHHCATAVLDAPARTAFLRHDPVALRTRLNTLGVDFADRYMKPCQGYTLLGALMMFVVGETPVALLVVNAVCGTLAVLGLYVLGRALFDGATALGAGLFLALSPYHLVYCRSALTEATAGFFGLLAFALWAVGRRRGWSGRGTYGLTGLALGGAITCHYRNAALVLVLLLVDFALRDGAADPRRPWWRRSGDRVRRWAWLAGGMTLPILALETVFAGVKLAGVSDTWVPTFLQASWRWGETFGPGSIGGRHAFWNTAVPPAYAGYLLHWHGPVAAALALLGTLLALRAKGAGKAPAVVVAVTFGLLLFQRYTVARSLSTAVPFLCLCMAVGAVWLSTVLSRASRPAVTLVLTALAAGPAGVQSWHLLSHRSQLAEACAFVTEQGATVVAVPEDARKYRMYLEPRGVTACGVKSPSVLSPEEALAALRQDGIRWIILDPQRWHLRTRPVVKDDRVFGWWQALEQQVRRQSLLAAEFPHLSTARWEFLAEGPGVGYVREMAEAGDGPLRIYDLQTAPPTPPGSSAPSAFAPPVRGEVP